MIEKVTCLPRVWKRIYYIKSETELSLTSRLASSGNERNVEASYYKAVT